MRECFECGSEINDGVCAHCEAFSGKSQATGSVSDESMREVLNHLHNGLPELVTKERLCDCVLWLEKMYDNLDHNGVRGL